MVSPEMSRQPVAIKAARPPLPIKFCVPNSIGLLPRKRLFLKIDTARANRIIWVSGPPGSGKTALLASYVASQQESCFWYELEEKDQDQDHFYTHFALALDRRCLFNNPADRDSHGVKAIQQSIPEDFFGTLCRQSYSPPLLVFDNADKLADNGFFFDFVANGVSMLPSTTSVVFISRRHPPDSVKGSGVQGKFAHIGWADIRFTDSELLKVVEKGRLPAHPVTGGQCLQKNLSGWVGGLNLLMQDNVPSDGTGKPDNDERRSEVFSYFGREVFDQTTAGEKDFLLKAAFLPAFSVQLAEHFTGVGNCGTLLTSLHRSHIFTEKRGGASPVYYFHRLFRDFLLEAGMNLLVSETRAMLLEKAVDILCTAGEWEEAMLLLARERQWSWLAEVAGRYLPGLQEPNRRGNAATLLACCPAEILQANPWLQYWQGVSLLNSSPGDGRLVLEASLGAFKDRDEYQGVVLTLGGIIESLFAEWRNFSRLDRPLAEFDVLETRFDVLPEKVKARVISTLHMGLHLRSPGDPRFEFWRARAEDEIFNQTTNPMLCLEIGSRLLLDFSRNGLADRVEQLLPLLKTFAGRENLPCWTKILWQLALAGQENLGARFEMAAKAAAYGLELARASGVTALVSDLFVQKIVAALGEQDHAGAASDLEKMIAHIDHDHHHAAAQYYLMVAVRHCSVGEYRPGMKYLANASRLAAKAGLPLDELFVSIAKGLVCVKTGCLDDAASLFQEGCMEGKRIGAVLAELICNLYLAKIHFDRGDRQAGLADLRQGLALAENHGVYSWPLWDRRICSELFVTALQEEISVDYVREAIRRHRLSLPLPELDLKDWPWPLRIYTMGRFAILRDEAPISHGTRGEQKPVVLLQALIALGGRHVPDTKLADILWPDADGDLQLQTLRTTLHRLRQILGVREAVIYVDGQLSLNHTCCWVDAWAYERHLNRAESALHHAAGDSRRADQAMRDALAFFHGPFLSHKETEYWTISLRERLRRKYIVSIGRLGAHLEGKGLLREAVQWYQKALVVDPLVEEYYQRLMVCYAGLGRTAEAVATFKQCRQLLAAGVGIEPSLETVKIFKKISSPSIPLS